MKRKLLALLAVLGLVVAVNAAPAYASTTYWSSAGIYATDGATVQDGTSMSISGDFTWTVNYSGSGWNGNPGSYCDMQSSIHNTTNGYYKHIDINTDMISSPSQYNQIVGNIGLNHWEFAVEITGWNCYAHMMVWH